MKASRLLVGPKRVSRKVTLVLDMDETLLHTRRISDTAPNGKKEAYVDSVEKTGAQHRMTWPDGFRMSVVLRPGVHDFLEFSAKHFEVILWTAGTKEYVAQAMKLLDPEGRIFSYVVYRHPSWFFPADDGLGYAKNLRQLGRDLSQTVLVDNTAHVCRLNLSNTIVISDFEHVTVEDRSDNHLAVAKKALTPLADSNDVRTGIKTSKHLHKAMLFGTATYSTEKTSRL